MKMFAKSLISLTMLVVGLTACGRGEPETQNSEAFGVDDKGGWVLNNGDQAGNQAFNFAKFATENPSIKDTLGQLSQAGNSYLGFGERDKFRAEMNLTVQTFGDRSDATSRRKIAAGYWLDTFVFNERIGGGNNRGMTLDLGTLAHMDTLKADVVVRFVGNDLYKGETGEAAYENSFMRDFNYEKVFYPVPMMGVKVAGVVGGELGMRVQAGVRRDNALGLSFVPRATVNAGLTGGMVLSNFASAEAVGTSKLADLKLGTSAHLGLIPSGQLAYGSIGVDGGEFRALDGKIELFAKAGLGNVLPAGVGRNIWQWVLGKLDIKENWEWRHTVFDPKLIYVAKIPRYGNQFAAFYAKPKDLGACQLAQANASRQVNEHVEVLSKYRDDVEGMARVSTEAALESFQVIRGQVLALCD